MSQRSYLSFTWLSRFGRYKGVLLALWMGLCPSLLRGELLLFEPFDYDDGPLVTVSGGLWITHSGIAGQVDVISGRADLRVPQTEDVSVLIPGQPYAATSPLSLFASFTVNFSALPSAGGRFFAHFKNSGTGFRARVFALTSGAAPGHFRIGIANSAMQPTTTNATDLALNVEQRVYLRYDINTATTTLWVNPETESSPTVVAPIDGAAQIITAFALRQDSGIGVLTVDDLRIGTTFADVYDGPNIIPPVVTQQPASTAAVEGGAATFAAVVSGTAPLRYQWNFNMQPLPDATNSTLVLTGLSTNDAGNYSLTITNAAGATTSTAAALTVIPPNADGTVTLVHYNVMGNFSSDWTTNAPQVQAIARKLQHLNPDIITLNEIPTGARPEMTNWMIAFFPQYQLAISPGGDFAICSGVISRFPITRSQSWLNNAPLASFGYEGTFTRDLFEAEIAVPGATTPVHVFTAHFKSGPDTDSQLRRAAESSAVSNFFATVYLSTNSARPYVLTGDLNEDIAIPMNQNLQPIQRLLAAPVGLQLTTPLNPFTLSPFTHSIQGSMNKRIDYILPDSLLGANVVASQVFRTDLLPLPLPPNLTSEDSVLASDHLPVVLVFNYPDPALRVTLSGSQQTITLNWPALVGREFNVEASTNLLAWDAVATKLVATNAIATWSPTNSTGAQFYRVVRQP
jgi:endonuclease/exonuclease/phosphatase family metal-dependent hydrolase